MNTVISKEEAAGLMNFKGEIRAVGMKSYADFIVKEEGEEGLKLLEKTMAEAGCPLKFSKMRPMEFYPLGTLAVMMVAIQRLFHYDNEKFQEMGKFHTKVSLIIRIAIKYFFSIDRVLKELPKLWRKHLSIGNLNVEQYLPEEHKIILRLDDYYFYPLHCEILKGYLLSSLQMIIKSEGTCEEITCIHKGGDCHRFLIKW